MSTLYQVCSVGGQYPKQCRSFWPAGTRGPISLRCAVYFPIFFQASSPSANNSDHPFVPAFALRVFAKRGLSDDCICEFCPACLVLPLLSLAPSRNFEHVFGSYVLYVQILFPKGDGVRPLQPALSSFFFAPLLPAPPPLATQPSRRRYPRKSLDTFSSSFTDL